MQPIVIQEAPPSPAPAPVPEAIEMERSMTQVVRQPLHESGLISNAQFNI